MTYLERYNEFLSLLPTLMKTVGFELQDGLVKSISKQFKKDDGKVFNNSDKLRKKSGALLNSFIDKNEESDSNIAFGNGQLNFKFGTRKKYAQIHEKGGFIKGTKRMESFFWAKYYETKKNEYKIIALSVKKKGGIKIKARNYFSKGVQDFQDNKLNKFLEKTSKDLLQAWKATE